jgi:hypothetical protein
MYRFTCAIRSEVGRRSRPSGTRLVARGVASYFRWGVVHSAYIPFFPLLVAFVPKLFA